MEQRNYLQCYNIITLTTLNLRKNNIGEIGAKYISNALKKNNYLIRLNLKNNKIKAEGAKLITEALKDNNSLTSLDLTSNEIGDKELETINKKINYNNKLVKNLAVLIKKYFVDKNNSDNFIKIASVGKHYKKVSKELLKKHLQKQEIDNPKVVIDEINNFMKECPFVAPRICKEIKPATKIITGELHIGLIY